MDNETIEIAHAGKRFKNGRMWTYALRDFSINIRRGDQIAILGLPGSGKSTALKVICGTEDPQAGKVQRGLSTSWPMPSRSFLSGQLTGVANFRFIARMYGLDESEYVRRVLEMSEIGRVAATSKMCQMSNVALAHVTTAMGLCVEPDVYLFDDYVVQGTEAYREKISNYVMSLGPDRAIVVATNQPALALQFCNQGYVLEDGNSIYYSNIEEAVVHLNELARRLAEKEAALAQPSGGRR